MSMNLSAHIKEATRCKSMIFLFFKKRLASLIVQVVKNPPALQETPVRFLGQEDPAGEGKGYPPQYSWASLVAQLVKNPPAMRETWVPSLGWKDSPGKGKAAHSSILAWRIPWTIQSMGSQSWTQLSDFHKN